MTSSRSAPVAHWKADLLAGLTVALVGLPQCLAYAMMSGLPPEYGLATAAVPGLVAALVGRSPWIITGPTNTTGLLILTTLAAHLGANGFLTFAGLPLLATLTLLAGVLRLVLAYSGGHVLVRFVPESVLVGFTAGAGILIGVMQLDEALGLPPSRAVNLIEEAQNLVHHILHAGLTWPALVNTVACIVLVECGRRCFPKWPVALLTVVLSAVVAMAMGLNAQTGLPLVGDRSPVPSGWPVSALPVLEWEVIRPLLVPALAITLLGTMELLVSVRADGEQANMSQEIKAQGWANVAGAFTSAFPASASLTRSALLRLGHARTRLAAAFAAVVGVPILFLGAPLVEHIPLSTLAGVLLITAWGMIDRRRVWRSWTATTASRALMGSTLVATLILPLEWAIMLGTGMGLLIHLAEGGSPRVRPLVFREGGLARPSPDERAEIIVLEVSGNMHYAAIEAFYVQARQLIPPTAKVVVVDLTHAHQVRLVALDTLERLDALLRKQGTRLWLAGVRPPLEAIIRRTRSSLPFERDEWEPGLSARKAVAAALADLSARGHVDPLAPTS